MRHIEISCTADGRWMYAVYINGVITVVGAAHTRERAEHEARLA